MGHVAELHHSLIASVCTLHMHDTDLQSNTSETECRASAALHHSLIRRGAGYTGNVVRWFRPLQQEEGRQPSARSSFSMTTCVDESLVLCDHNLISQSLQRRNFK